MTVLVVGSLNVDQISYCPRLPCPGETLMGTKYETGLGGKGANQAVQCALLGSSCVMVGAVGDDPNGKWYLDNLPKSGVDCSRVKIVPGVSTGVAPITVATGDQGENCIVVIPGANYELKPDDITEELIRHGTLVVCQNELLHETTMKAMETAHKLKLTTVYSPAPCPSRSDFNSLAPFLDFVIANESEARELAGADDIEMAARHIEKLGVKHIIITLGSKGQALLSKGKFDLFPAFKVDAVDTTGAGDSFAGAFVHGLNNAMTTEEALKLASRVSALSVTKKGTQKSYPSATEIALP